MEYVIKIYNGQFETLPFKQIQYDVEELNIKYDLNNFDITTIKTPYLSGFRQFQKIEIYEVLGEDTLVFEGYISNVVIGTEEVEITAKGTKDLMNYKLLTTDLSYSSKTIQEIGEGLVGHINSLFGESWEFETNLTGTIDKEYKKGDNLYDIFSEIAETNDVYWTIVGNKIMVKETLGVDRTSSPGFVELVYNGEDHFENNITQPLIENHNTVGNYIIAEDGTNSVYLKDDDSIDIYGALGIFENIREGTLSANAQSILDLRKEQQKKFKFDIQTFDVTANIGDKLYLRINNTNDDLDFTGNVIVTSKEIDFINRTKVIKLGVSDVIVKENTLSNIINEIKKNIKYLQINI